MGDSYAKGKGVKAGWQVLQVGDQTVPLSVGPGEVRRLLDSQSQGLDLYTPRSGNSKDLKVNFLDREGNPRIFVFKSAPLGLIMAKDDPTVIQAFSVGSYAKEKG